MPLYLILERSPFFQAQDSLPTESRACTPNRIKGLWHQMLLLSHTSVMGLTRLPVLIHSLCLSEHFWNCVLLQDANRNCGGAYCHGDTYEGLHFWLTLPQGVSSLLGMTQVFISHSRIISQLCLDSESIPFSHDFLLWVELHSSCSMKLLCSFLYFAFLFSSIHKSDEKSWLQI